MSLFAEYVSLEINTSLHSRFAPSITAHRRELPRLVIRSNNLCPRFVEVDESGVHPNYPLWGRR